MKKNLKKTIIIASAATALLGLAFLLRPPVSGGRITSWYGPRIAFNQLFHSGIDISLPAGSPVRATSWGIVKETGFDRRYGNYIIIRHLPGTDSRYMHLHSVNVLIGQKITPKTVIGTVGNTGMATGNNLHFEIRAFGVPLPPYLLCLPGRIIKILGGYKLIDPYIQNSERSI